MCNKEDKSYIWFIIFVSGNESVPAGSQNHLLFQDGQYGRNFCCPATRFIFLHVDTILRTKDSQLYQAS